MSKVWRQMNRMRADNADAQKSARKRLLDDRAPAEMEALVLEPVGPRSEREEPQAHSVGVERK